MSAVVTLAESQNAAQGQLRAFAPGELRPTKVPYSYPGKLWATETACNRVRGQALRALRSGLPVSFRTVYRARGHDLAKSVAAGLVWHDWHYGTRWRAMLRVVVRGATVTLVPRLTPRPPRPAIGRPATQAPPPPPELMRAGVDRSTSTRPAIKFGGLLACPCCGGHLALWVVGEENWGEMGG